MGGGSAARFEPAKFVGGKTRAPLCLPLLCVPISPSLSLPLLQRLLQSRVFSSLCVLAVCLCVTLFQWRRAREWRKKRERESESNSSEYVLRVVPRRPLNCTQRLFISPSHFASAVHDPTSAKYHVSVDRLVREMRVLTFRLQRTPPAELAVACPSQTKRRRPQWHQRSVFNGKREGISGSKYNKQPVQRRLSTRRRLLQVCLSCSLCVLISTHRKLHFEPEQ